ncbi:MAG: Asd/ArgC dimerization domain-containing protein [Candidatus Acidiferrales bacterium]
MPAAPHDLNRVAIVGAASLRGKELKEVLEDRNFPADEIILLDEGELAGTLTEAAGEPTFIRALQEESFEHARYVFFAGSVADAERNMASAQRSGATVIDLTGAASRSVRTQTWIPSLTSLLPPRPSANGPDQTLRYSSPAASVIITCSLAAGFSEFLSERLLILLFPPVSERDRPGVDELESQTASLLSFRDIAKPVFDAQVAFNLLSRYGESSKVSLGEMRSSVARDVAHYLDGRAPVPAIQLVQAPVFYGYAFTAYAEFRSPVTSEKIHGALASLGMKINADGDAAPTNASVAGENDIHIARIEPDPSVRSGVWLWGVADNLRLSAVNAVRIAEELLAQSLV